MISLGKKRRKRDERLATHMLEKSNRESLKFLARLSPLKIAKASSSHIQLKQVRHTHTHTHTHRHIFDIRRKRKREREKQGQNSNINQSLSVLFVYAMLKQTQMRL